MSRGVITIMQELTERQKEVVEKAKKRMAGKPWFKGVCLDNLPSDAKILKHPERSVNDLIDNTMYWDA